MLAFLKSIFGGRTAASQSPAGLAIPRTVYTPQPRAGAHRPIQKQTQRPAEKPDPAPETEPVAARDSDSDSGSDVDISLQSVLKGLPPDIKERVRDLDIRGATMTISLERILAQLPSGSVKISFGSLRHAAPQLFSAGVEFDGRDVNLPLDEILAKVNPAMMCQPQEPAQRFEPTSTQAERRADSEAATAVEAEPAATQRAASLSVPPVSAPGETEAERAPAPSARQTRRARKAARNRIPTPQPAKTEETAKSAPDPSGEKPPAKSGGPERAAAEQKSTREEIPDLFFDARKAEHPSSEPGRESATPTPIPPGPTSSPSVQPAEQSVMRIALKELTGLWPEKVRAEVAHWNLEQLMVALPAERVNAALKQGKVAFPWKDLRSWILPPPPSATSLQDKALLELPLPIIMPLFLAARKQDSKAFAKAQPQIADDIPDPFADFLPQNRRTASADPANPAPSEAKSSIAVGPVSGASTVAPKSGPAAVAEASPSANVSAGQVPSINDGAEASRKVDAELASPVPPHQATPAEVLATALNLEGVVGALVALADGFKVASKLPAGMDGDALAAFLPHIFSKVNQSTRELRMGELNNLNFTVDNVPWKIFRVDQIFFAALGHAGKPMPTSQLAALAHQLTFKN